MRPKTNLDFLRSIAVLLVVADHTCLAHRRYHLGPWDPSWLGSVGVFMFFVHTTLVLMWSLERRPHVLDFYIRRIFRIYPLAIAAIVVALLTRAPLVGTVENFFGRQAHTWADIATDCLLLQNLRGNTPPIVNVEWTLPFEMQMYVVLPALFAFARQSRRVWPLLLMWALTVALCCNLFPSSLEVNLVVVAPMFLPGVMAYVLFGRQKPVLDGWLLGVLIAAILALFMRQPTNRNGWYVALALGLALPFFREIRTRWVARACHLIAQYSYGIYLTHPFALVLAMYVLRGRPTWLQLGVEAVTICVASVLSYHLLEQPMIRLGARLAARVEGEYEKTSHNHGF